MPELKFESLHNHTVRSDGKQTHTEVLQTAEASGIGIVAFTDHDTVLNQDVLGELRSYQGPVKWLSGIEITSLPPKKNGDTGTLHVLGLFVDPFNAGLTAYCQRLAESRLQRMRHYVSHLRSLGFTITEADCIEEAGGGLVGSPHIVNAINRHPENQQVINNIRERMTADAEQDEQLKLKYRRLQTDPGQLPYILFMKSDSYIPFPKGEYRNVIHDLDTTVSLIRGAGGIAVLAHWYFNKEELPIPQLEELAAEKRIDGVELAVANRISKYDATEDSLYLRRLAGKHNLATTVGSDSHDGEDLVYYSKSQPAHESVGSTKALITRFNPSLEWSNL